MSNNTNSGPNLNALSDALDVVGTLQDTKNNALQSHTSNKAAAAVIGNIGKAFGALGALADIGIGYAKSGFSGAAKAGLAAAAGIAVGVAAGAVATALFPVVTTVTLAVGIGAVVAGTGLLGKKVAESLLDGLFPNPPATKAPSPPSPQPAPTPESKSDRSAGDVPSPSPGNAPGSADGAGHSPAPGGFNGQPGDQTQGTADNTNPAVNGKTTPAPNGFNGRPGDLTRGLADRQGPQGVEFVTPVTPKTPVSPVQQPFVPLELISPVGIMEDAITCFPASVSILCSSGEKPISDIRAGDTVLAFPPQRRDARSPLVPRRVTRLFRNVTREWLKVTPAPGHEAAAERGGFTELVVTPGHRILAQAPFSGVTA